MSYLLPFMFLNTLLSPSFFIYLINLEALLLLLYCFHFFSYSSFGSMFILCVAVVESCLGLVCLILNVRNNGKDLMIS